ncbi:AraC family transcriptional regulator [Litchfieldia salsa]|uniref:AraC-type DNA-binding protein n=1 Tax=Litchfieldia salsa TaxID=930152 RepID=A0A1H0S1A4_9BACI|nr:AraC family transcriptional regulator [Litchfieldia salsa]SDP35510.1 AraC-type DNA-binding protein [Litchfieldia salsa]
MSTLQPMIVNCFSVSTIKIREGVVEHLRLDTQTNTLIYIASGRGRIAIKDEQLKVMEGKSYIMTEEGYLFSSSQKLLTVYIISWNKTIFTFPDSLLLANQDPVKIVPLWEEAILLQERKSISEQCKFQGKVWSLLSSLTDQTEVDRIEESKELIIHNLSTVYTISALAEKAKMTPNSFARAFKKQEGISPKEYIIAQRIKAAKTLMLQNKGITAKEIALKVGLQDEFYFSRIFKQKVGQAPTVFMKRTKERIAVVSQLFLQDHLLSLGIQPVAAPAYPSEYPANRGLPGHLSKQLEGTRLLNAEKLFNAEEILYAQPDRIIKTPLHKGEIQSILLSHEQKVEHISLKSDWNDYLREIASLLNLESMVDAIENEISCLETKVKDELRPITRRGNWAVIWVRQKEIRLYGRQQHACLDLIYNKLGFEAHPGIPSTGYRIVTVEELAILNADKLLILWSHEQDVWKVVQTKKWKMLKAVQTNHVYYPKSQEWDPWGPIGRKHMLVQFASEFQKTNHIV